MNLICKKNNSDKDYGKSIEKQACSLYATYLKREVIYPLLINDKTKTLRNLDIAGAMYHQIETSLMFEEHRRAVWYMVAFERFCRENLSEALREHAI